MGRIPGRLCSFDDDFRVQTQIPGASTVTANTRRGGHGGHKKRPKRETQAGSGPHVDVGAAALAADWTLSARMALHGPRS